MEVGTRVHQGLAGTAGYNPIYAIFEGGGAKGIAHLGALKALEDAHLAVAGVAGSSAGAIIAALVALGFKSNELFDVARKTDILAVENTSPIRVLGTGPWWRFTLIRKFGRGLAIAALSCFVIAFLLTLAHTRLLWLFLAIGIGLLCVGVLAGLVWPVLTKRGLFDSTELRRVLNTIFLKKLNAHLRAAGRAEYPDDHWVTFGDINPVSVAQCATLKVIVSDIRSGQLSVFDHNTPDVVVAQAVAASASIPFAFQPPPIAHAPTAAGVAPVYVDGGLISNLPVWSFRAEKRSLERSQGGPPIPILALSLDGADASQDMAALRLDVIHYLVRVIQTGIFGSQKVVQRFIPDLEMIALESTLTTMKFDCTRADAIAAFEEGFRCASVHLTKLRQVAEVTTRLLAQILAEAERLVAIERTREGKPMPRLRVNLVEPIDDRNTAFRIVASVGMDDDPDDRLELDSRNDVAPKAFEHGQDMFALVAGRPALDLAMTKYERALVCPKLVSVICIPVWASPVDVLPERVLCIDSTDSLLDIFGDPAIMDGMRQMSLIASRSGILKGLGIKVPGAQQTSSRTIVPPLPVVQPTAGASA